MLGIDISKWNDTFDWSKAQKQNVELAYLKASGCGDYGNYADFRFKENGSTCPLPYKGAYHYFDYRKPGADQCKFFLDKAGSFGNLRGVIDLEDNSANFWPKMDGMIGTALKYAFQFVEQYKLETGYLPVLYISAYLTNQKDYLNRFIMRNFHECPLWVAHYTNAAKPSVGGWVDWSMWQYSSTGDGRLFGNAVGNVYIDLNQVKNVNALLKPGITIEDPVVIPPVVIEPTDKEKLRILWEAYKAYQNK
jgi:lysozyme